MANCIRQIGKRIIGLVFKLVDLLIYISPLYYRSIEWISVRRWFAIQSGNYNAFYRVNLGYIPKFFYDLYFDLTLKFEHNDISIILEMANVARLNSMAIRNNDSMMKFNADCLNTQLQAKLKANEKIKPPSMNEFTDYIELTFESIGMIDVDKMSISKAHSLYNKAIDQNKRIKEMYAK